MDKQFSFLNNGKDEEEEENPNGKSAEELEAEKEAKKLADAEAAKRKAEEEDEEDEEEKERKAAAKKKEEEDKDENENKDEDEEKPIYKEVIEAAFEGVTLEEDDIKDVPDTVEGLVDVIKKVTPKIKKAAVDEFLDTNERIKEYAKHVEEGLSDDLFRAKKQVELYSSVEIKEDNVVLQEKLYRAELASKGTEEDEIDSLVAVAKDNNKLLERSKKSKDYFIKIEKEQIDAQEKLEKEARKAEQDEIIAAKKILDGFYKTNKIAGIEFKPEVAKEFQKFITDKDKTNAKLTKRDAKWNSLTTEELVLVDIFIANDFKLPGIVSKTPVTKEGRNLKDLKKDNEGRLTFIKGDRKDNGPDNPKEFLRNALKQN